MLNIPQLARRAFTATIVDYYQNNLWHFRGGFEERYLDLGHSIRSVVVLTALDRLVWTRFP